MYWINYTINFFYHKTQLKREEAIPNLRFVLVFTYDCKNVDCEERQKENLNSGMRFVRTMAEETRRNRIWQQKTNRSGCIVWYADLCWFVTCNKWVRIEDVPTAVKQSKINIATKNEIQEQHQIQYTTTWERQAQNKWRIEGS